MFPNTQSNIPYLADPIPIGSRTKGPGMNLLLKSRGLTAEASHLIARENGKAGKVLDWGKVDHEACLLQHAVPLSSHKSLVDYGSGRKKDIPSKRTWVVVPNGFEVAGYSQGEIYTAKVQVDIETNTLAYSCSIVEIEGQQVIESPRVWYSTCDEAVRSVFKSPSEKAERYFLIFAEHAQSKVHQLVSHQLNMDLFSDDWHLTETLEEWIRLNPTICSCSPSVKQEEQDVESDFGFGFDGASPSYSTRSSSSRSSRSSRSTRSLSSRDDDDCSFFGVEDIFKRIRIESADAAEEEDFGSVAPALPDLEDTPTNLPLKRISATTFMSNLPPQDITEIPIQEIFT